MVRQDTPKGDQGGLDVVERAECSRHSLGFGRRCTQRSVFEDMHPWRQCYGYGRDGSGEVNEEKGVPVSDQQP